MLEARERNVISDKRTVKMAANHNAEALKAARQIIDYSATAELLAPPTPEYRIETAPGFFEELDRHPARFENPADEVASTPTPISPDYSAPQTCQCKRCRETREEGRQEVRQEAGIALGPQPLNHRVSHFEEMRPICICGDENCPLAK